MTLPCAALLLAFWPFLWEPRAVPGINPKSTLLLGHRGVRGSLPENSLAAFRAALDAGLDGVETDLQTSRDGHIVLIHDFSLPDGRPVGELTLSELHDADPNVPTLDSLLTLAQDYPGTLLNLELKTYGWRTGGLERAAARAVQNSGLGNRVLISSFNPLSLMRLRLRASGVRTALLYRPDGPDWLKSNRAARLLTWLLDLDALHPHSSLVDAALTRWAARRGVMLNTWTVNDPQEVKRLTRLNVNGLMADDPKALKDAFKEALWSLED